MKRLYILFGLFTIPLFLFTIPSLINISFFQGLQSDFSNLIIEATVANQTVPVQYEIVQVQPSEWALANVSVPDGNYALFFLASQQNAPPPEQQNPQNAQSPAANHTPSGQNILQDQSASPLPPPGQQLPNGTFNESEQNGTLITFYYDLVENQTQSQQSESFLSQNETQPDVAFLQLGNLTQNGTQPPNNTQNESEPALNLTQENQTVIFTFNFTIGNESTENISFNITENGTDITELYYNLTNETLPSSKPYALNVSYFSSLEPDFSNLVVEYSSQNGSAQNMSYEILELQTSEWALISLERAPFENETVQLLAASKETNEEKDNGKKRNFEIISSTASRSLLSFPNGKTLTVENDLLSLLNATPTVRVIVSSPSPLSGSIMSLQGGLQVLEIGIGDLQNLTQGGATEIYLDRQMGISLQDTIPLIGASRAQAELNASGDGVAICLLDTGVDFSLPSLSGKAVSGFDFVNNDTNASDDNGHGTFMASVIHAVAPNATMLAVKVLDASGTGYSSNIMAGIDYCKQLAAGGQIKIISMSFGGGNYTEYCGADLVAQAAEGAVSSGLLAVASTGNNGANYITAPACAQSVTAVSSTSKSDTVSPFSNMNGMVDLLAPGENVQIPGTGGTYIKSGTSVSAAHVSGAAALLLQSNSSMTPAEMQYRFQTTGAIIPFNNSNFTRINVYNAILNNITSLPSNQTINETNQTGNYTYNASITSIGGCDIAACGYPGCQINTRGETYSIDRSLTTSGGGSETCLTVNAPSAIIVGNANIITATTLGDIGIAVAAPSADISGVKFDAETAILVNSDSANIHDNTIRDTAANIYGINWQSGNGGTISGNTISSTATGYIGIYFQSGSSSTVTGNKINGEKAIRADNPFSSNTLLNHNNLTGTTWIDDQGSSNPWDDGTAGNEYHFSNNTGAWKTYNIYDTNGDGWADAGSDLPFTSTNVAQMLGNAVDNHPYAGASVSSCQDITTPGIYSLNQSFGGPGTCIYIGASNVALHGMGYTLSGTIKTEKASGVAISNLTIDPGYGLIVSATNSSSFSNISITNVSLIGIWATNSSNRNNFTNIAINSSGATGIQVDTSSANNSFIGIYINESGSSHGIYSAGGSGNYFNCASGYITGRGNSTLCLQDQANVSTMCNGISAGTYACTGVWDATQVCALAADGDWSTMGVRAAPKNAFIWMNYTKPSGATSSSVWMAQLGANAATNYTIPSGCFGQQPLQFQVSSYNNGSAEGACYDGSAWVIIASTASSNRVFEEAMYWSSQPYGIYSNQTNTSVLGCNVAAFYTGINYNGANGTIMNSAVHDNWNNGLAFSGSNGNTIGNLSAYLNNGSGFDFAGSSSNAIGNITSYSNGIYGLLLNSVSENNSIVNLTAYKNTLYGVYVSSSNYNNITSSLAYNNSEGFNWYGSSYCQISSSTSRDNSQYGFRVQSQQYNNFTGNTAYNNSNDGFYVYRSLSGSDDFNTISSSTSYNNTGNGFRMGTNSNAINFTNNTAYNNRLSGFNFTSVDKALITNSTSYANLEEGARLQITNSNVTGNNISSNYSTALNITATSTSIFANNTLNGTGFTLVLSTPTTSNNFTNNTLLMSSSGVTLASVLLYIPAKTSNGNTFWHNNFTDTSALYITDAAVAGAPNYYNISNVTVALGNIYANVISGTVPIAGTYPAPFPSGGASAFYYGSAGSGYPYSDTTSVGKTTGMTADNGPITPLSSASCLNLTTNYTLVQNVISTGGTCFSINANNITLNCSGYSITGANASDNIAVFSNRNYSMLRDCYITNFSEDLRINNGVGAIIFNNTLLTTFAGGNATHLMNGTNITNMTLNRMSVGLGNATVIETISLNNTVDCQGGSINGSNYSATYGIYTSQTNTTVKNCQISNLATGIFFNGVENGTINNTNASSTQALSGNDGYGIYLLYSNYSTITNSIGNSTAGYGIYLYGSSYNNITASTAASSTDGALFVYSDSGANPSSHNTITGVNATSAGNVIYLYCNTWPLACVDYNTIENSSATVTGNAYGIFLYQASNNKIINSTFTSGIGFGIFFYSGLNHISSNNSIINSTATGGQSGIALNTVRNTTVTGSTMSPIFAGAALNLNDAWGSTIANNTMNGIGLTALSLAGTGWGSYTNLFINNTLISAGGTLLSISAMSGNNTFYWNNFTNTSGAYVQDFNFTSSGASSNLFNTSNSTTPMGNIYFNVMNGSVAIRGTYPAPFPSGQPTAFYYGSAGAGYPYNNSSTGIGGKFIGNGTDYGPITSSSGLSCGIINTAGTYTMNSNLSSPGATCFNITAANVLLNCSNYTIKGDNTTGTYGIVTSAYNTTIINCSINSFYYGIYYANGSYNGTAQYNTVYSNLDIGLRFVNSSNNSLTSNSFCTEPMDIDNAGLDNGGSFGTLNTCDSFLNYSENSHSGCTFACTSLWHRFFGNVSGNIVLGNGAAYAYVWNGATGLNVYVADKDSAINWTHLQAIGRKTAGGVASTADFYSLDSALGNGAYKDNISNLYSSNGITPFYTDSYNVYGTTVNNVPVFNSSRFNTTFHTGILWDNSTGAGYDPIIKQPIVWVVKVNTTQVDAYGNYQYLVSIPYTLSTYEGGNSLVSFYAELQ